MNLIANRCAVMREKVHNISQKINNPKLQKMFLNCFFSTLDTTTKFCEDGTVYVFTGDIPAMWLRDSSAQVSHYLEFCNDDAEVKNLVKGLIKRQIRYILHDPYANAFNLEPLHGTDHCDDYTDKYSPLIWERKYEIDSLCYPIYLTYNYIKITNDLTVIDRDYLKALLEIISLWKNEQNHFNNSSYFHQRPKYPEFPTLTNNGRGTKVAYTGMTWSGYRPSDDVCQYGYLIPSNMFAVVVLKMAAQMMKMTGNLEIAEMASELCEQIDYGIKKYGIVNHPKYGKIYAYETDGLGNYNLMDDANVPSLLTVSYLGYCQSDDEIYQNTRRFILSKDNPYYFEGKFAKGVGSPHTPQNYIWHIGIIMQLLTSDDEREIKDCFDMLLSTDAGLDYMHESFDADNPDNFTREWFSWANSCFAKAVLEKLIK